MDFCKRIKFFGLYFYVSTCRLKRRGGSDRLYRNNRRRLLGYRHRLYKRQKGRCYDCGASMREDDLEIHHVVPVSERPDLVAKCSNLRLLCHECHLRLHSSASE